MLLLSDSAEYRNSKRFTKLNGTKTNVPAHRKMEILVFEFHGPKLVIVATKSSRRPTQPDRSSMEWISRDENKKCRWPGVFMIMIMVTMTRIAYQPLLAVFLLT
mmetsp:Transcript_17272/g.26716  ORF Transcript_17272/g.26716 Transcript_17272/m.26716 type:complete len:104 (-) Transcript_17272:1328-1639(-)